MAHRFIRQNRSFSDVKNLATSLIIICQKEKNPVIFRENRHALRTCGSAVTQRFIPYCQLSSRRMKGVVSKETVVLRRWESSIQKFGFINGVDKVNWSPYRDSKS